MNYNEIADDYLKFAQFHENDGHHDLAAMYRDKAAQIRLMSDPPAPTQQTVSTHGYMRLIDDPMPPAAVATTTSGDGNFVVFHPDVNEGSVGGNGLNAIFDPALPGSDKTVIFGRSPDGAVWPMKPDAAGQVHVGLDVYRCPGEMGPSYHNNIDSIQSCIWSQCELELIVADLKRLADPQASYILSDHAVKRMVAAVLFDIANDMGVLNPFEQCAAKFVDNAARRLIGVEERP